MAGLIPTFRRVLVETRGKPGHLLFQTGRLVEAEVEFREAMAVLQQMADEGRSAPEIPVGSFAMRAPRGAPTAAGLGGGARRRAF